MGHHINDKGEFQSDRHPELPPDHILISARHPEAGPALYALAMAIKESEPDRAVRILEALESPEDAPEGYKFTARFREPAHRPALGALAFSYMKRDLELAIDILRRLFYLERGEGLLQAAFQLERDEARLEDEGGDGGP